MNGHLRVGRIGYIQAIADRRWRGAPVFMQLEAHDTGIDLLMQCRGQRRIAFAEKSQIHRERIRCLQHALNIPWPRRAGGGEGARGRPRAPSQHGGDTSCQSFLNLLRADEMDMRVNAARRHDIALATDDLRAGADDDVHAGLHVRVARLANGDDAPALQTNVGLHNAPMVDDERIGHHAINGTF